MRYLSKMEIGNRLLAARKKSGLTQAETAELAGVSDRAYADIERGGVNMRLETFLRICQALRSTPNDLLTDDGDETPPGLDELIERLSACTPREAKTAMKLLSVYLASVDM